MELASLRECEVAELVMAPCVIEKPWLYKVKLDGTFKGLVRVQEYRPHHGINCGGTIEPVCRFSSKRKLLCLAASKTFTVQHPEIKTGFLNSLVEEDVYVKKFPGYEQVHPPKASR